MSNVSQAPNYKPHRKGVTAIDASNQTSSSAGANFAGFDIGFFQVIPSGGANPTIELLSWSEFAGEFISVNTPATFSGLGADIPYEFSLSVYGRIVWVKFTTLASGSVDVYAGGRRIGDIS